MMTLMLRTHLLGIVAMLAALGTPLAACSSSTAAPSGPLLGDRGGGGNPDASDGSSADAGDAAADAPATDATDARASDAAAD